MKREIPTGTTSTTRDNTMIHLSRRNLLKSASATTALLTMAPVDTFSRLAFGEEKKSDSLPMQLYKSLSDEQRQKICLPRDHERRQYISNWWYIHPEHRIPGTFNADHIRFKRRYRCSKLLYLPPSVISITILAPQSFSSVFETEYPHQ